MVKDGDSRASNCLASNSVSTTEWALGYCLYNGQVNSTFLIRSWCRLTEVHFKLLALYLACRNPSERFDFCPHHCVRQYINTWHIREVVEVKLQK